MPPSLIRRTLVFTVFLLELLPLLPRVGTAQASPDGKPIIEAQGHGEAHGKANRAIISLAVDSSADTADAAVKAGTATVEAIKLALKPYLRDGEDSVVAASQMITPDYSASGINAYSSGMTKRAYFATERLTVTVPTGDMVFASKLGAIGTENGGRFVGTDDESTPGKTLINIDVSSVAVTPVDAARTTTAQSRKIRQLLEAKLDGRGSITVQNTAGESSLPARSPQSQGSNFAARCTLTITLDQIDLAGRVTDEAIKAGASRLNSVTFDASDTTELQTEAIAAATENAKARAQAQASALHLKLGPLLKSSTAPFQSSMPRAIPAMAGVIEKRISPIDPGQVSVSADVTLTYATE